MSPHRARPGRRILTPLLALAVVVVAALSLTSCGRTSPRNLIDSIRDGSVILGTKYDQPGLGLRHPNKDLTGFDTDVSRFVVNWIADQLGVKHPKISWKETPSAQRETLIKNGEVDMIAATYSINASRAASVDFAGPYLVNYQGLLVRKDDTSIQQLTDLSHGKKLCSATGSTSAQNVKAQLPGVQLQEFDTYSSCVEGLRRKRIDALTTDEVILAGFANFIPNEFRVVDMTYPQDACVKKALKKAGTPFSTERYGIGVGKGQKDTVQWINRAITAMLQGGNNSPWVKALSDSLGAPEVQRMQERAAAPGSSYHLLPDVGDLSFLDSKTTPCPAGKS